MLLPNECENLSGSISLNKQNNSIFVDIDVTCNENVDCINGKVLVAFVARKKNVDQRDETTYIRLIKTFIDFNKQKIHLHGKLSDKAMLIDSDVYPYLMVQFKIYSSNKYLVEALNSNKIYWTICNKSIFHSDQCQAYSNEYEPSAQDVENEIRRMNYQQVWHERLQDAKDAAANKFLIIETLEDRVKKRLIQSNRYMKHRQYVKNKMNNRKIQKNLTVTIKIDDLKMQNTKINLFEENKINEMQNINSLSDLNEIKYYHARNKQISLNCETSTKQFKSRRSRNTTDLFKTKNKKIKSILIKPNQKRDKNGTKKKVRFNIS